MPWIGPEKRRASNTKIRQFRLPYLRYLGRLGIRSKQALTHMYVCMSLCSDYLFVDSTIRVAKVEAIYRRH